MCCIFPDEISRRDRRRDIEEAMSAICGQMDLRVWSEATNLAWVCEFRTEERFQPIIPEALPRAIHAQ